MDSLESKEDSLNKKKKEIEKLEEEIESLYKKQLSELEKISEMTKDQARQTLLESVEREISHEVAVKIREYENRTKEEAERKARSIIALAIQKSAAKIMWLKPQFLWLNYQMMKMKGRIIGREGRNIRTP